MIAAVGTDEEAAHVIHVELADGFNHDVKSAQFYGRGMTGPVWECFLVVGIGLGAPRALSGLGHMPLQRLYQSGTVSCGVCKCEAWLGGIVSNFDCSKPHGANGEYCTGVQVANQGGYAG